MPSSSKSDHKKIPGPRTADQHPTLPSPASPPIVRATTAPYLHRFQENGPLPPSDWLALFEVETEDQTDQERIRSLYFSLEGDALRWYAQFIAPSRKTLIA
jgi:hypothetical protein